MPAIDMNAQNNNNNTNIQKNTIVHLTDGQHARKQGRFIKHNGKGTCVVKIDENGRVVERFVQFAHVRAGALPVNVTPPTTPAPPRPQPPTTTPPAAIASAKLAANIIEGQRDPAPGAARAAQDDEGYLYIFRDPTHMDRFKIGRARDVEKRLRDATTYVPNMRCMGKFSCSDYVRAERLLQAILAPERITNYGGGNEWFRCDQMVAFAACTRACSL